MASYFDLPPQHKATAASIDQVPKDQRKQLGGAHLMSPALTQLLDDLGHDNSDSSSDEDSLSDDEDLLGNKNSEKAAPVEPRQDKQKHVADQKHRPSSLSPRKSSLKTSTTKSSGHVKSHVARTSGNTSVQSKQKQPHMARYHSLRSMLFQASIADKMKTATREECPKEQDAATKWKSQHAERQMHDPKTPENAPGKEGLGSRIKMTMRRMTSKDVGGMEKIREDGAPVMFDDRASTASSESEDEPLHSTWKHRDSDEDSIDHSDVEELVRWVSRRDPPSDGEARKSGVMQQIKENSDHESLGHSDVDDLVRHASRRTGNKEDREQHTGYSDASTESDTELQNDSSDEEEDADDLVRWISRRDGPKAGPVRRNLERREMDSDVEQQYDSDVPELGRWFQRNDCTSGESAATTPVHETFAELDEPERGRQRSRESTSPTSAISPVQEKEKRHLDHNDVDELIQWMTKTDSKQQESPSHESQDSGVFFTTNDDQEYDSSIYSRDHRDSLTHNDLADLVEHARKRSGDKSAEVEPIEMPAPDKGDLSALRAIKFDEDRKKQQLGMAIDKGSLSHSDLQDLINHVRKV